MGWIIWSTQKSLLGGLKTINRGIDLFREAWIAEYVKIERNRRRVLKKKMESGELQLESAHAERLPFLKKSVYKKLLKERNAKLSRGIRAQEKKGGYWNWKTDTYFSRKDKGHPRNIWRRNRRSRNLVKAPLFYAKYDRDKIIKRLSKKKFFYRYGISYHKVNNSIFFNDWGWQKKWTDRKKNLLRILEDNSCNSEERSQFKINRKKKNFKSKFIHGAEGIPFWTVSWWKKRSFLKTQEWNPIKFSLETVTYVDFKDKNGYIFNDYSGRYAVNRLFKRASAKFLYYFFKKSFKIIFYTNFLLLKKNNYSVSKIFFNYSKFKLMYWVFAEGLKNFILKTAARPAAYFLTNMSFSSVFFDEKDEPGKKKVLSHGLKNNLFYINNRTLASSYGAPTRADSRSNFSNYLKINNYIILKYFFYMLSSVGPFFGTKDESRWKKKFTVFFKFIAKTTAAKYKKVLSEKNRIVGNTAKKKNVTSYFRKTERLKKLTMYRIFFSSLSIFKQNFLEWMPVNELRHIWTRERLLKKPKLLKDGHLLKHRGIFYRVRKKFPKWYKSNKRIRLFKRFTRNYSPRKSTAEYNANFIIGLAGRHFKITSCKKYFKQKIYIRAKFASQYKAADRTKMNNRWKYIQKARHKWHGFYNEFEGNLLRASSWLGFSNKYKLSKFLFENNLVFLNGSAGRVRGNKCNVREGDIVYLRKDIFRYIQVKRELKFYKRYLAKFPFYNKTFKNKIIYKASKILRARAIGRSYYKRKLKLNPELLRFLRKFYINRAKSIGYRIFDHNQPRIKLMGRKEKWHSKVKKYSSIRYVQNILKLNKVYISASDDQNIHLGPENFLMRINSSAILSSRPTSVNNFYYGTDFSFRKSLSPRVIKYFSERRFNY